MEILKLKNTITKKQKKKKKASVNGLDSRVEKTKEKIHELEDRLIQSTLSEQQRERRGKLNRSFRVGAGKMAHPMSAWKLAMPSAIPCPGHFFYLAVLKLYPL